MSDNTMTKIIAYKGVNTATKIDDATKDNVKRDFSDQMIAILREDIAATSLNAGGKE